MKKYLVLASFVFVSAWSWAGPFTSKDVPEDVKQEIRRANIQYSGMERKKNIEDAIEAYVRLQNKAYDSGIPRKDLEIIIVRLHQMYGANFIKQSVEFDKELDQYKDMVQRVEERVRAEQQKKSRGARASQKRAASIFKGSSCLCSRESVSKSERKISRKLPSSEIFYRRGFGLCRTLWEIRKKQKAERMKENEKIL